jgi:uncharacterized protein (TIGR01370 family)
MIKMHRPIRSWLCYYGLEASPEVYGRFDLVVFDSTWHPPLVRRADGAPVILGYLSLGEVLEQGPLWPFVKNRPCLVEKKSFWDSWVVDVRDPAWQRLIVHETVPGILAQGFDGLFLDTLDSALGLEMWKDPDRFRGAGQALVRMVRALRSVCPEAVIAVNRGLHILPRIAEAIDVLVLEGLYSVYEGTEKRYKRVDKETRGLLLKQVEAGLSARPDLPVLSLDYAAPDQPDLGGEAIAYSREKGFIPYVSTVKLDQIYEDALDRRHHPCAYLPGSMGRFRGNGF